MIRAAERTGGKIHMHTRQLLAIPTIAGAALLIAFVAYALPVRGQEGDRTEEIEAAVEHLVDTFNAGDPEVFADLFTDEGLLAFVLDPSLTREEAIAEIAGFMGFATVELLNVRDVEVTNGTATAIAELSIGGFVSIDLIEFTDIDGEWIISDYVDGVEQAPLPDIPDGYKTIFVDLLEYEFVFDAGQIQAGDLIAFEATNIGEEPHEIVFIKVPEDFDLLEALESEDEPEGIEDLAFTFAQPGQVGRAIVTEALGEGRYIMVCFVPTDGVPHALLGMVAEFTLELEEEPTPTPAPAPTPTPTPVAPGPPATGTGGVQAGGPASWNIALAGVVVILAGGALLLGGRRNAGGS
jgi:hypothetical protein